MTEIELLELIAINALKIDSEDMDADEVIETLEQVNGTVFDCNSLKK